MPLTLRTLLTQLLVLLATLVALNGPAVAREVAAPEAKAGEIDLRQWNFKRDGPVFLGGEWGFYWQKFIDPAVPPGASAALGAPTQFADLPAAWAGSVVDGQTLGANGYASYRLQVSCASAVGLTMAFPVQHSSVRMFINGREVARQGKPGVDDDSSDPAVAQQYVPVGDAVCPLNVVAHVSNFDHRRGGLVRGIQLGDSGQMQQRREAGLVRDMGAFGGLALLSVLPILFFLWRPKEPAPLYFGLFCVSCCVFVSMSGERAALPILGPLGWDWYLCLMFLSFYGGLTMFARYVHAAYPREFGNWQIAAVSWLGAAGALLSILTPGSVFTLSVPALGFMAVTVGSYITWVLVKAAIRTHGKGSAPVLLGGFAVVVICVAHDWIFFRHLLASYWLPYGLLAFALAPGYMLARRMARALASEELRYIEQRERSDLLVRVTKAGLLDWDTTSGVITYSDRYREIMGYPSEAVQPEIPGFFELIHPQDSDRVRQSFASELRNRSTKSAVHNHKNLVYRMRHLNGDYVWVHAEGMGLRDTNGWTLRFICSFIDISDAKRLEQQMTEQVNQKRLAEQVLSIERDRLQLLVRTTKAGFSDWDAATETMTYSDRYLEMMGYTAGTDTSGWPTVFMFMHEDDRERARAQFREMVEFTGQPGDTIPAPPMVGRLRTADGSYLWIHAESVSQIGDDGRTRRIITSYLDITVFREQQELLATERRRLDLVVRGSRVGIVDWEGATHETYYSPRFREIRGYAPDAETGDWPDYFKVMIHPDDRDRIIGRWVPFIKGKGPEGPFGEFYSSEEYRLLRADGSYVWCEVGGMAVRDARGFVVRWIAFIIDITERREQQEALRASHDQIAAQAGQLEDRVRFINDLVDSVPVALAMRDIEGRYVFANRTWEQYYALRRDQVMGRTVRELREEAEASEVERLDHESLQRGADSPPLTLDVASNGKRFTQTRTVMTSARGEPVGVVVASADVTERYEMEQALATEQRRIALVVRAAKAGIVDWDGKTRTAFYSPRLRELLGYSADTDTSSWPDYFEIIHPEDAARVHQAFADHIKGKGPAGAEEFHQAIEYRLRCADGGYVWVQGMGVSVRDQKGYATRFIASLTDITERRAQDQALHASHDQIAEQASQLETQNEALMENVRLREEVERIARHDIKTPLNSIIAVPRLLREERRLSAEADELLGIVERAGYRILSMVNLSLDLYKMEQGSYIFRPDAVDMVDLVDKVAVDIRGLAASRNVQLKLVSGAVQACAWAEELLCYSLVANLLKNAVEASPEGATVTVTLQQDEKTVSAADSAAHIVLGIHNDGMVPVTVREKFFTKYTTAGKASGTGLGTYSARMMARTQDGDVTMQTSAAEGTTLRVILRAAPAGKVPPTARHAMERRARQPRLLDDLPPLRVLLVDDDEYNLLIVRRFLPSPPLRVTTAFNGRVALEMVEEEAPDIMFMDLDMPVMGGLEAIGLLRQQEVALGRPRGYVVVLSSHDDEETRARCMAAGFDHYLSKPVTRDLIQQTLLDFVSSSRQAVHSNQPVAPTVKPDADGSGAPTTILVDSDVFDLLPGFLPSRHKLLDEMGADIAAGDREGLRRRAHQLGGSLGLYGFQWAADVCKGLETGHAGIELSLAASLVNDLRKHLQTATIVRGETEQ
ncbi:MAG: PAS domain-containing protein [Pseudomonadota bacterium]